MSAAGSVTVLKGSQVTFEGTATRELAEAFVNGEKQLVDGNKLVTHPTTVDGSLTKEFTWRDELDLFAKQPFELNIKATDDEQPSIQVGKMQREQVLLDGEVLSIDAFADDDFGVKRVGLEWVGIEDALRNPNPASGEKVIIDPQDPEMRRVEAKATFSNTTEGIKPQSLLMRMYAVDYKPDAERSYSPTYLVHVLTAEEHAIWLTNQLRKWFRSAQQVYETEQQLHETNRELRALSQQQIDLPENRRRIENQASAESANARRLTAVTGSGEELIRQAMKNDQFNVQTLETWAEMLNALNDIAAQRMPSVADLLKQASNAPAGQGQPGQGQPGQGQPGQGQPGQGQPGQGEPGKGQGQPGQGEANQTGGKPGDGQGAPGPPSSAGDTPPEVGNNRDQRVAPGGQKQEPPEAKQTIPKITDTESSFNELDDSQSDEEPPPSKGGGKFGLPVTTVVGGGDPQESDGAACPAGEKMDEAVEEQEDLLAEFAKVAEELQKILNNLEGSTFVKRLKAASRRQIEIAGDLNDGLLGTFGMEEDKLDNRSRDKAEKFAEREVAQSENVFLIQDDMEAYFNRVQQGKFRGVLQDMRETQVVGKLRDMSDTLAMNLNGQSIAEAEFWADNLDRWAEQLVGPG